MGVIYAPSMLDRIPKLGTHERCLEEFRFVLSHLEDASAILHGSVVTGNHRTNSDLDAIVHLAPQSKLDRHDIAQYIFNVFISSGVHIEATVIDDSIPPSILARLFTDPLFNRYLLSLDDTNSINIGVTPAEFIRLLEDTLLNDPLMSTIEYVEEKLTKSIMSPFFNPESQSVLNVLQRRLEIPKAISRKIGALSLSSSHKFTADMYQVSECEFLDKELEGYLFVLREIGSTFKAKHTYTAYLEGLYESTYEPAREYLKNILSILLKAADKEESNS